MNKKETIISKTKELFPDIAELKEQLENPDAILSTAFPLSYKKNREWSCTTKSENYDDFLMSERRSLLEGSRRAILKIEVEGKNAELTKEEENGLEAIIHLKARPAILIQEGHFFPPIDEWKDLDKNRSIIENVIKSVGRIETPGHPSMDYVGTGFMVSDDVVMTNRHVAKLFCRWGSSGDWIFEPDIKPSIDFNEEIGSTKPAEFAFTNIIGVHDILDLALIRVSNISSSAKISEPLSIASKKPEKVEDRKVYVVGYPARDSRNDSQELRRLFSDIYNVKRLQPGLLKKYIEQKSIVTHDCSTLGGNSGSCVVDLESGLVVGLHFWGRYMEENRAIALWDFVSDPLLKKAGVNFIN